MLVGLLLTNDPLTARPGLLAGQLFVCACAHRDSRGSGERRVEVPAPHSCYLRKPRRGGRGKNRSQAWLFLRFVSYTYDQEITSKRKQWERRNFAKSDVWKS
ncbi:uncharacterized protein LOC129632464 isoform X5 [Bubalus kerabau]|uniref:uncharacterized protein LOC129632464 isoform X5 n=1 Tax=Bubalus carabanensis TaxID=3119969 RepID=UPI001D12B406|nr:uncharacterized protein LOC129632464 isoform X5 [Bubalus carabanensis]